MKEIIKPSQLTKDQCRQYLIEMDKEAADFWRECKHDLCAALNDDLHSFGEYETLSVILRADTRSLTKVQL